jgi:lipopolysaccharide transport system permease protein
VSTTAAPVALPPRSGHPRPFDRARWTLELVRVLAPRELRTRYRQSVLDVAWAFITPIAVAVVYGIVLTSSFDATGNGVPYLSMAWSGLVLWTFAANAIGGAVGCLVGSSDLVTKVYFPREALPLGVMAASLPDLAIGLLTVAVLLPIQGVRFGWTALLAPLPLVVLIVWVASWSVLSAVLSAFVRDVPHLVGLLLRVGFFATPVMYDESTVPEAWRWSVHVSPVAVSITGFRDAVLRGNVPDLPLLGIHLAVGIVVLLLVLRYTRAVELRVTDVL